MYTLLNLPRELYLYSAEFAHRVVNFKEKNMLQEEQFFSFKNTPLEDGNR